MQTAQIIPFKAPLNQLPLHQRQQIPARQTSTTHWLFEGKLVSITDGLTMGIRYKKICGKWETIFVFRIYDQYTSTLLTDDSRQIDLRHVCGKLITHIANKCSPGTQRPVKSVVVIDDFTALSLGAGG